MKLPPLLLGTLLLSQPSPSPPFLCRVQAEAAPTYLPGIYDVTIIIRPDLPCPPDGRAFVRVESGRVYPWREIFPGEPVTYPGVPWWWLASWQALSGKPYHVKVRGLQPPWSHP
ncbi:hypothetical protein GCM10022631_08730 [Deinococcus rubellus]|uniref:Uncharacterized protein n=1 Tax=Deinococcus rubellus TaxID=1889240 RepID=A0ABY5YGH6_9DEIO|nr:hypothetical protein [Deinococcus rubellus]UWX64205.1 hypothetical protein N0D28_00565 [Deinococcus rubellus]